MQASEFLQLNCFTLDGMTTVIPIKFPQSKTFPLLLALFLPFWNLTLFSFQGARPGLI